MLEQAVCALLGRTRTEPGSPQRHLHVLGRVEAGDEVERLEDDSHAVPAVLGERRPRESGYLDSAELHAATGRPEDRRENR